MKTTALLLAFVAGKGLSTVPCGGSFSCPDDNTCCPRPGGSYGCVPSEAGKGDAVCCAGGELACPTNYTCAAHGAAYPAACVSAAGPQPDPTLSAAWPYPMGMAGWQQAYRTCPAFDGAPPLFRLPLADAGGLEFPYYSSVGALGSEGHADVEVAMLVQHGANRNADDYFCSGLRAASLLAAAAAAAGAPPPKVAVIAPRFMEPADAPPPNTAWWNGSDPVGYWRAGAESDPAASAAGNVTVSSFAVLDALVAALATDNRAAYPKLRMVVIAGHSSGGQIVQRHALFTRLPPVAAAAAAGTAAGTGTAAAAPGGAAAAAAARVRHVVANPSSFAYLDDRRWFDGALRRVSGAERAACPLFNDWQFGFGDGSLPPFCARGNASAAAAAAVAAYAQRDVVYLQGHNDTCNEAFVPGCESHGLETTCMDMLEGRFRLERGLQYSRYLAAFYGRETVHRLFVVPDVGHDHSLIWDGSLAQIFG